MKNSVREALDRRLDPTSTAPIVVALSGGGDSLALLHLTVDWAREHKRPVLALTVDHGLNPESAGWTVETGVRARALGVDWRALRWEGPKPATGLQAKARTARHALLAVAAREAGARVLLMGHTADDVAEGEVMRAGEAPGLGYLREWSPSPAWPEGRGVFLLRPLLHASRGELRDYLAAKEATWLDDPANEDRRYARVRARQILSSLPPSNPSSPGLTERPKPPPELGSPAFAGDDGSEAREVRFNEAGATASRSIPRSALSALLLCLSGGTQPPRGAELDRLLATIAKGGVATLCGSRIEAGRAEVRITRAPPRRGQVQRPPEPVGWITQRFHAACGLYADEASIPVSA